MTHHNNRYCLKLHFSADASNTDIRQVSKSQTRVLGYRTKMVKIERGKKFNIPRRSSPKHFR